MKSQISQAIDAYIRLILPDDISQSCRITDMDEMRQLDPATMLHEVLSR